jgi:uncharacterized protein
VIIGAAGILSPGKWQWLRAIAWALVLAVLFILTVNVVADAWLRLAAIAGGGTFTTRSAAPEGDKLVGIVLGACAALAVYWGAVRLAERRTVPELALRHLPFDLALGLALGGALIASIIGISWSFGWVTIEARPVTSIVRALRESIQSGVFEEVLFRLVLFRLLWRAFGIWPALLGSASLFGVLHLTNPDSSWFAAVSLMAGEGVGIGLYLLTGRIWASIGMHAAWNFVQGWVFGARVSGMTVIAGGPLVTRPVAGAAELLSGGGFGPEASIAALPVSLVASVVILRMAWARGDFQADTGPQLNGNSAATSG